MSYQDYVIEDEEHCGLHVRIYPDMDAMDPRENFDYNSTFFFQHNRYTLGDVEKSKTLAAAVDDDCSSWAEVVNYLRKFEDARVVIPVWMIDHSGIALRAGRDFSDCDPGAWDSGIVGIAFQTGADIREQYMVKRITKKVLDSARENLIAEVEEYSTYLEGGVVGFCVEDDKGDVLESCWGFYDIKDALAEGKSVAEYEAKRMKDDANMHWLNCVRAMIGLPPLSVT